MLAAARIHEMRSNEREKLKSTSCSTNDDESKLNSIGFLITV